MAAAEIKLKILEDGTVTWETGLIPAEHHDDSDDLLEELEEALGGQVIRKSTAARPRHVHHTDHEHTHEHNE